MQGLQEVLGGPSGNSVHTAGMRETQWTAMAFLPMPMGETHLFSLVVILRLVRVRKIRTQYLTSVRTGSDNGEW